MANLKPTEQEIRKEQAEWILAAGPVYGLELVLHTHSKVIKTKADIVVVWMHWCLLRNGFSNHGGEFTRKDYYSENLPANLGWNGDKQAYILKYLHGSISYVIGMYLTDDSLVLSLVSIHKTLRIVIAIPDLVSEDLQLSEFTTSKLAKIIDKELIRPSMPHKKTIVAKTKKNTKDFISEDL